MKTLLPGRPALTAETLAGLITAAGVPCVTLVDDDEAAAEIPARPQDEGLRIVRGSMPVRVCYPIPLKTGDDDGPFHAALSRKDSHTLWLYDWAEQYRWHADRDGPHADPWTFIYPDPRPATYPDDRGREISRATGGPIIDPYPVRWVILEFIDDPGAYAGWIEADVAADIAKAGQLRASREYMGSFRLREAERIRAAGLRSFCGDDYRHADAELEAWSRRRSLAGLGIPGVRYEAWPVTGYASCTTCLWPVTEAAGRWWHRNGDCSGPRKIRDLPTEPGDWEFDGHSMTCGYCGGSISWKELLAGWARFTGVHSIGVQLKAAETGYAAYGRPGDLVVLAEVEVTVGQHAGTIDFLPHYCDQIPGWLRDQLAARRRAALAGEPYTRAVLEPTGEMADE